VNGDRSPRTGPVPLPKQIDERRVMEAVNPLKESTPSIPEGGPIVQGRRDSSPSRRRAFQQMLAQPHQDRRGQRGVVGAPATSWGSRWP